MTLTEASSYLDPPLSRRTLERLVLQAGLPHFRVRRGRRGRSARLYRSSDIFRVHAAWVRGEDLTRWRHTGPGE